MGLIYWQKSDYDEAMICYEKTLKICEEIDDMLGIAITTNNMGAISDLKGDYDTAMIWYQKVYKSVKD